MTTAKAESAVRWNVIALAFAGPALLGVIVWIIYYLTPARWCGALIGAAKEARIPAPECTSILIQLLRIHRDAVWILGGTLGLVIIAIGLAATGMSLRGRFAGNELNMGAREAADAVADAAASEASAIKGEQP
jgi:hypothetical protein